MEKNMSTDTQTCTQCHTEKPLSEFHRRGDHYQKSCKICRCLKAQEVYNSDNQERTTSPETNNEENVKSLSIIVERMERRLHKTAIGFSTSEIDADDVYSFMVEAILTKAKPSESIAVIFQRAKWAANDYVKANRAYDYHVDAPSDESPLFATSTTPEDIIVENEVSSELQQIINQLPEHYRTVISMLSVGMTQRQIAKELHISNAAVNQRLGHIRKNLTSFGLSFA